MRNSADKIGGVFLCVVMLSESACDQRAEKTYHFVVHKTLEHFVRCVNKITNILGLFEKKINKGETMPTKKGGTKSGGSKSSGSSSGSKSGGSKSGGSSKGGKNSGSSRSGNR